LKSIALIPARLESKRLPNKILKNLFGLPMIEHVRRRAVLSGVFYKVYVVTNNKIIKKIVESYGGNVLLTKKKHLSGTSRVSEIVKKLKFNRAFVIFSDEPFITPEQIKLFYKKVKNKKKIKTWNAVTSIRRNEEKSIQVVKILVNKNSLIKNFYRKTKNQINKITTYKSSGLFAFDKKTIEKYENLSVPQEEKNTSIEQFRLLKNNIKLGYVKIGNIYPSINTPDDMRNVIRLVKKDKLQLLLIKKTQAMS
jgi:3-deoxy-manno-octulosonate cytidylyltransferase (CMP-KDO synthetase)